MSQYVQATSAAGRTVLCGATSYAEQSLHAGLPRTLLQAAKSSNIINLSNNVIAPVSFVTFIQFAQKLT